MRYTSVRMSTDVNLEWLQTISCLQEQVANLSSQSTKLSQFESDSCRIFNPTSNTDLQPNSLQSLGITNDHKSYLEHQGQLDLFGILGNSTDGGHVRSASMFDDGAGLAFDWDLNATNLFTRNRHKTDSSAMNNHTMAGLDTLNFLRAGYQNTFPFLSSANDFSSGTNPSLEIEAAHSHLNSLRRSRASTTTVLMDGVQHNTRHRQTGLHGLSITIPHSCEPMTHLSSASGASGNQLDNSLIPLFLCFPQNSTPVSGNMSVDSLAMSSHQDLTHDLFQSTVSPPLTTTTVSLSESETPLQEFLFPSSSQICFSAIPCTQMIPSTVIPSSTVDQVNLSASNDGSCTLTPSQKTSNGAFTLTNSTWNGLPLQQSPFLNNDVAPAVEPINCDQSHFSMNECDTGTHEFADSLLSLLSSPSRHSLPSEPSQERSGRTRRETVSVFVSNIAKDSELPTDTSSDLRRGRSSTLDESVFLSPAPVVSVPHTQTVVPLMKPSSIASISTVCHTRRGRPRSTTTGGLLLTRKSTMLSPKTKSEYKVQKKTTLNKQGTDISSASQAISPIPSDTDVPNHIGNPLPLSASAPSDVSLQSLWTCPQFVANTSLDVASLRVSQGVPSKKGPKQEDHPLITVVTEGDKKLFRCEMPNCGKLFTRRYNLVAHIRCHQGDRPYQCETCLASFARKHDLIRHTRSIHEVQKKYGPCPHCQLFFTRSDAFKRHVIIEEKRIAEGGKLMKPRGRACHTHG